MKRFKIIDPQFKKDGLRIYDKYCPTLSARDYKEPKMVIEYECIYDIIRQGYSSDNQIGGGISLTKKHCWDMVKVIQVNKSTESSDIQPYQQNRIYDTAGISPAIDQSAGRWSIAVKDTWKYQITCNCGMVYIGILSDKCPSCNEITSSYTNEIDQETLQPIVKVKSATKAGYEEVKEGDSINMAFTNSKTSRGRVGAGVGQTLDTQCNQAVIVAQRGRYKDNGKTEQTLEANTANTLTSVQKDNMVADSFTLEPGVRIRRLTPSECEKLQGFPVGWTSIGNYDGMIKPISNTQRYKMCGNAVTKDIVELIARKLLKSMED